MIIPEKEWKVVINERIGERSYHKNEIRQIEIHKGGYAPVKGFAFGFMMDLILYYFISHNFELGSGG